MICDRCGGTGFLNYNKIPKYVKELDDFFGGHIAIVCAMIANKTIPPEVQVCDKCGDGKYFYDIPGRLFSDTTDSTPKH